MGAHLIVQLIQSVTDIGQTASLQIFPLKIGHIFRAVIGNPFATGVEFHHRNLQISVTVMFGNILQSIQSFFHGTVQHTDFSFVCHAARGIQNIKNMKVFARYGSNFINTRHNNDSFLFNDF